MLREEGKIFKCSFKIKEDRKRDVKEKEAKKITKNKNQLQT